MKGSLLLPGLSKVSALQPGPMTEGLRFAWIGGHAFGTVNDLVLGRQAPLNQQMMWKSDSGLQVVPNYVRGDDTDPGGLLTFQTPTLAPWPSTMIAVVRAMTTVPHTEFFFTRHDTVAPMGNAFGLMRITGTHIMVVGAQGIGAESFLLLWPSSEWCFIAAVFPPEDQSPVRGFGASMRGGTFHVENDDSGINNTVPTGTTQQLSLFGMPTRSDLSSGIDMAAAFELNRALTETELHDWWVDAMRGWPRLLGKRPLALLINTTAAEVFTATAAVSVTGATCSGSATHTAPTFSATAAVSVTAATCAGAAAHTPPTFRGHGSRHSRHRYSQRFRYAYGTDVHSDSERYVECGNSCRFGDTHGSDIYRLSCRLDNSSNGEWFRDLCVRISGDGCSLSQYSDVLGFGDTHGSDIYRLSCRDSSDSNSGRGGDLLSGISGECGSLSQYGHGQWFSDTYRSDVHSLSSRNDECGDMLGLSGIRGRGGCNGCRTNECGDMLGLSDTHGSDIHSDWSGVGQQCNSSWDSHVFRQFVHRGGSGNVHESPVRGLSGSGTTT